MMKRILGILLSVIFVSLNSNLTFAIENTEIPEGVYDIDATLSCYINAMGGVEFGAPLLESAQINVNAYGEKTIILNLTKSSVTIYGVTCDTFVDAFPAYVTETNGVKSGTIGYYDRNNKLKTEDIKYTLSDETVLNSQQNQVQYVDSISFPIESPDSEIEIFNLSIYVNSNVMGTQFTVDGYPAILTLDWTSFYKKYTNNIFAKENTDIESDSSNDISDAKTNTQESKNADNIETKDIKTEEKATVENMEGMNIYSQMEEKEDDDKNVSSKEYTPYFKESVFDATKVVSIIMIIVGVVFILSDSSVKRS